MGGLALPSSSKKVDLPSQRSRQASEEDIPGSIGTIQPSMTDLPNESSMQGVGDSMDLKMMPVDDRSRDYLQQDYPVGTRQLEMQN